MIKVENLKFKYDQSQNGDIINIPFWEVKEKESIFISGPSGSGKSTLIHLLSGLIKPSSGAIFIDDIKVNNLSAKKRNKFRANHVGLISQQFNLIPYISVLENIELAHSFQSKQSKSIVHDVKEIMEKLKLSTKLLHRKSNELSIGQQQRVAIIRAIINKPKVLLADEPTSALDSEVKLSFIQTLKEMTAEHRITLLFISHDISLKNHFEKSINMEELNAV